MAWLQAHMPSAAIPFVSVLSAFGEELVILLITGFLYWGWDKRAGRRTGLSVLLAGVWCPMVKNIVKRRRPYFDHGEIRVLRVVEPGSDPYDAAAQGFSFPSSHSANAAALYGSVARAFRRMPLTVLSVLLPLLVGFSRVAVGAHYPTDVLAGWCVGTVSMLLVPWLDERIRCRPLLYGLLLLTVVPGFFFCRSEDFFSVSGLFVGFVLGAAFEERFVCFENTKSPARAALRVAGGVVLFLTLDPLLKALLPEGRTDTAVRIFRCLRYAVVAFAGFGLYPALFRYTARIGGKRARSSCAPSRAPKEACPEKPRNV